MKQFSLSHPIINLRFLQKYLWIHSVLVKVLLVLSEYPPRRLNDLKLTIREDYNQSPIVTNTPISVYTEYRYSGACEAYSKSLQQLRSMAS